MIRILRIEAWRSPGRLFFPLLLAIDMSVLFGRSRWWIGIWPQASVAAQLCAFYVGPVTATLMAWVGGRASRARFEIQLSAANKPRWIVEFVSFTAAVAWALAAYGAGFVAATITSFRLAGPGFLWPSYFFLGASVLIGCAGFGYSIGRLWGTRFTAPIVAGLASLIVLGALGKRSGLFVLSGPPDRAVVSSALALRMCLALAVCLVAIFVGRLTLHAVSRPTALLAIASFIVTAALFYQSPAIVTPRESPRAAVCTTGPPPQACVWPDDRKYQAPLAAMVGRIRALPANLFKSPQRFYEQGLRSANMYDSNHAPVYTEDFFIREGAMWDVGIAMANNILQETLGDYCTATTESGSEQRAIYDGELAMWLTARITGDGRPDDVHGGPSGVNVEATARLITRPEAEQVEWVREKIAAIQGVPCV